MGVGELRVVSPPSLAPDPATMPGARILTNLGDGLRGADVVMALRIQKERIQNRDGIPDGDAYFREYGISHERMKLASPDAIVMHPGPMNRGVEIESSLADGPSSVITDQVTNGVAVRMAVLNAVAGSVVKMSLAQKHRGTIFVEDATVVEVRQVPGRSIRPSPACTEMCCRGDRPAASRTFSATRLFRCDDLCRSCASTRKMDGLKSCSKLSVMDCAHSAAGKQATSLACWVRSAMDLRRHPAGTSSLLIGGGVGIPPMVFLAETLHCEDVPDWQPLVIMGSEIPFPFEVTRSKIATTWLDADINSTMPLLESWQIPTRLASLQGYAGCYKGYVTDLAREWLESLSQEDLAAVEVFSCGPTPMLQAVASLSREYGLPCQVSLEEFMACAVGGCAGCTVPVTTDEGVAMKRVCVDGPVFDATTVFAE